MMLTCQCSLMIKDIRGPFCPDMFIYDAVKENAPLHSQLYVITEPGSDQVIEDYKIPSFIAKMFCYEYDEMLVEPPLDGDYQDYLAGIFKSRQCREAWCVLIDDALPSNPWYSCDTVTEVAGGHLCHITLTDDSLFSFPWNTMPDQQLGFWYGFIYLYKFPNFRIIAFANT